jgi:acetyl-CoA/propionyl-CoA carboxylase biotin carboxyl carrier protein
MPGTVIVVSVAVGDRVVRGQALVVVEAMKMEHTLTAPFEGSVSDVPVAPGASVALDELLVVIAPGEAETGVT